MTSIRSLLWIGPGRHFEAELTSDSPTLDVVWKPDLESALPLPRMGFDALVLDAESIEAALHGLRQLARPGGEIPILVRLERMDAAQRSRLLDAGASEALSRSGDHPPDLPLGQILERLPSRQIPAPGRQRESASPSAGLIGESPAMREVFALVECAGRSSASVLLTGETGTGKELVARAIHAGSPRREAPFVAVNCGAFPDTLLESELFGYLRGAFTGADRDKKGLFEEAHRGTLFLDEVSETTGPFHAKLLRALQEREIRPLGSTRTRRIDVRVIAASNRDLWSEARAGRFREDVYYRLAVFPIRIPPLRERPRDLLRLAEHFLKLHHPGGRARNALSPEASRLLHAYRWPGNVRELENEVQRALALAHPGEPLTPAHFSERLTHAIEPVQAAIEPGENLRDTLARVETWLLRQALEANDGRRTATAKRLGITREGLYKKMKRYGIE